MNLYFVSAENPDGEDLSLMVQASSFEDISDLWLDHYALRDDIKVGAFTETRPDGPFFRVWTIVNPEPHRAQSLSWEHRVGHSGPENRMQFLGFYPLEDIT